MNHRGSKFAALLGLVLSMGLLAPDDADARRRGGSFGSRGARTYQAPPPTRTAQDAAPIQRSMTPPPAGQQPGAQQGARSPAGAQAQAAQQPRRAGFLGGLGGGLLGGLLLGGLVGGLMGNGFGAGMAGFATILLQLALVAGVVFLAMKLFRRRQQPAPAGVAGWSAANREPITPETFGGSSFGAAEPSPAYRPAYVPTAAPMDTTEEIGVTGADRDTFERLLIEVQAALGREDYAALRERTTPEIMGYLAEELGQNATDGRRNEISDTKLLQADISEAWREGDTDYATAAMRYDAVDVVRDRASGAVIEGDLAARLETTELWTFVRKPGGDWKLSAIQEA